MEDKVHTRLRSWIAASGLKEGARLPAERELATTLGVTRAELRKALLVMEVDGRLERGVGRGTFLAKRPATARVFSTASGTAALAERTGPHEAMSARIALEPELAAMAAIHGTPLQLRELRSLATAMRAANSWAKYEKLDADFHDLIAQASGNSLLHEVHKIINGVRLVVVWGRLNTPDAAPSPDYHSFAEHDEIAQALELRDGAWAHKAMKAHLTSTLNTMTIGTGG